MQNYWALCNPTVLHSGNGSNGFFGIYPNIPDTLECFWIRFYSLLIHFVSQQSNWNWMKNLCWTGKLISGTRLVKKVQKHLRLDINPWECPQQVLAWGEGRECDKSNSASEKSTRDPEARAAKFSCSPCWAAGRSSPSHSSGLWAPQ